MKTKNDTINAVSAVRLTPTDIGLSLENKKVVSPVAFSLAIRTLLQNWRQGTVGCKGRSEVAGSNKKPWKQKGTGRARAGAVTSPVWRGGGVTFGPQERSRTLSMNKKLKKSVAATLIWNAFDAQKIVALDWVLHSENPSTRSAYDALKQAGLHTHKFINLFLMPHDLFVAASFANIPNVRILFFDSANAYDLADSSCWVVLKKDQDHFKEMVAQWI